VFSIRFTYPSRAGRGQRTRGAASPMPLPNTAAKCQPSQQRATSVRVSIEPSRAKVRHFGCASSDRHQMLSRAARAQKGGGKAADLRSSSEKVLGQLSRSPLIGLPRPAVEFRISRSKTVSPQWSVHPMNWRSRRLCRRVAQMRGALFAEAVAVYGPPRSCIDVDLALLSGEGRRTSSPPSPAASALRPQ